MPENLYFTQVMNIGDFVQDQKQSFFSLKEVVFFYSKCYFKTLSFGKKLIYD